MNNIPIYIINLEKRKDRKEEIIKELNKYKIDNYEFIKAIEFPDGYIGCALSHIIALDLAIKNKYDKVIILEDDFIFLKNPNELNIEIDFDVFLLGGTIYEKENIPDINFLRIKRASRTEGYIIKKHYYKTLKNCFIDSVRNLLIKHTHEYKLDILWKHLQVKDKFYINSSGLIGGQREGYSDIQKQNMKRPN